MARRSSREATAASCWPLGWITTSLRRGPRPIRPRSLLLTFGGGHGSGAAVVGAMVASAGSAGRHFVGPSQSQCIVPLLGGGAGTSYAPLDATPRTGAAGGVVARRRMACGLQGMLPCVATCHGTSIASNKNDSRKARNSHAQQVRHTRQLAAPARAFLPHPPAGWGQRRTSLACWEQQCGHMSSTPGVIPPSQPPSLLGVGPHVHQRAPTFQQAHAVQRGAACSMSGCSCSAGASSKKPAML